MAVISGGTMYGVAALARVRVLSLARPYGPPPLSPPSSGFTNPLASPSKTSPIRADASNPAEIPPTPPPTTLYHIIPIHLRLSFRAIRRSCPTPL